MAGIDNLRPPFTPEEARKLGKKGGVNSAKSKRRKKTIAETMDRLLNETVKDPKQLAIVEKSGMPISGNPTYKDFLVASVIIKSIKNGRVDDLQKMMEIIGEEAKRVDTETLKKVKGILGAVDSAID